MTRRRAGSLALLERLAQAAMIVIFVSYATSFLLPVAASGGVREFADVWLNNSLWVLGAVACLLRACRSPHERTGWSLLAAGLSFYAAGSVTYYAYLRHLDEIPYPSVCDWLWLAMYPFAYAAMVVMLRARLGSVPRSAWLDGLVAALGATALGAALVDPLLRGSDDALPVVITNLSYPVADLVLLCMLVGGAALQGWRPGKTWWLLTAGLCSLVVTDYTYLLAIAGGTYVDGSPVDLGWGVTMMLLAGAASVRPEAPDRRAYAAAALVVPMAFAAVALGVLAYSTERPVGVPARVIALLALVAAIGRTVLTVRELGTLASVRQQATTDDLTGLANRRSFLDQLERHAGQRAADSRSAVLLVDLDRFKEINDSFGHHAGDALLRQIGPRLAQVLRGDDLLARLGGDEFAVLLPDADAAEAQAVGRRMLDVLREPFVLEGMTLHLDASIGLALCPRDAEDATSLMRHADAAMYEAKRGHLGVSVYAAGSDEHARERLLTLEELRTALTGDQLVAHYQPKVDVGSGHVVGAEALVRWQHPRRGLLGPDVFLPLAEQAGLMRNIALQVLERALRDLREWRAGGQDLHVAVNLSASDLQDLSLPPQVGLLLDLVGVPAHALTLEITENVLMADAERAHQVLGALRALGVRLSVDDYGTGFSSLAYLRTLPVQELKLDRTFVTHLVADPASAAIVRSTISLAHELCLTVVAEGVEDAASFDQLAGWGCDFAQGFHLGRPQTPAAFASALDRPAHAEALGR